MNIIEHVANITETDHSEWEYTDGPTTGVGAEYWLVNSVNDELVYVVVDNDDVRCEFYDSYEEE